MGELHRTTRHGDKGLPTEGDYPLSTPPGKPGFRLRNFSQARIFASDMEPESPEQAIGKGYKYLAAGLRFAGGIVVFLLGGLGLDSWLHTTPLFLLIGTVLGAVLGFLSVYRELMADQANRPTWKNRRGRGGR